MANWHDATVFLPAWAWRLSRVAELVTLLIGREQTEDDGQVVWITGEIAKYGCLPGDLVALFHELDVPYDYCIKEAGDDGGDLEGFWRPGMSEAEAWSSIGGEGFLVVSAIAKILDAGGTDAERVAVLREMIERAQPTVPPLHEYPDPREQNAAALREVTASMPAVARRRGPGV